MEVYNSTTDAICCVLARERSQQVIDSVLKEFIPNYERLNGDYTFPKFDPDYVFSSEEEMISYFIHHSTEQTEFFWNQQENNADKMMIGAFFTSDEQLVMSLTLRADGTKECCYLQQLKKLLHSEVGTLNYALLPEFDDGEDFKRRYSA